MKRTLKELQELWNELSDIPVNENDEIEEDFWTSRQGQTSSRYGIGLMNDARTE